jgi:heme O synthase-like polyprenyltransferase
VQDRKLRKKVIIYGLGFLFLSLFGMVCVFFSPVYARIGYLIGAILIYKAYSIKKQPGE